MMKFTVGGHEYSVEWLATCTGLFLACAWLLVLLVIHTGDVAARDFISVAAFFGIGFSAVELIGAFEIYCLWHDENYALRAEAWRRFQAADREAAEIRDGSNPDLEIDSDKDSHVSEQGIPINGGRDGYIITHRVLTDKERAWGEFLTTLALHAAAKKSFKSPDLVGDVISQPNDWTAATNLLRDMGLVYKANGDKLGTRPIRSFEQVVNLIPMRLGWVTLAGTPPPIPPAPPETLGLLDKSRIMVKGQ